MVAWSWAAWKRQDCDSQVVHSQLLLLRRPKRESAQVFSLLYIYNKHALNIDEELF